MRYGAESRLSVDELLGRARSFFGPGGELGLTETPGINRQEIQFVAPDGGVSVSAQRDGSRTEITILSREYDHWVERFLREKL